jgi:hypothetical protein
LSEGLWREIEDFRGIFSIFSIFRAWSDGIEEMIGFGLFEVLGFFGTG